jgi:DNA-binding IclR family transcriptional regulator
VLHGSETLYLLKELPTQPVSVVTEVGVRLPAHLTASGRALMSHLSSAQLNATLASNQLVNRTGFGPKSIRELQSLLASERAQGYSFEESHVTLGYSSIAAASSNHLGMPIAALALTFRQGEVSSELLDSLSAQVKTAADELSKRVGTP